MRRQKRDLVERAYNRGYLAGLSGRSKSLCPTENPEIRQSWMNGWRAGREDNWAGLQGVSAIHRLPIANMT